jgi:hypothetical protein
VIRAIKDEGIAARGQIIREIKATTTQFGTADFVHENIRSNMDAHTIARSKIYADFGRQVWLLNPPQDVCNSYNSIHEYRVTLPKNQQYNRLIDGDATLPWCSQIDVSVDDEAPVLTSGISRSIGPQPMLKWAFLLSSIYFFCYCFMKLF